jgi:hypothetical protein
MPLRPARSCAKSEVMPKDQTSPRADRDGAGEDRGNAQRPLTPAAERALAEAAARRAERDSQHADEAKEVNGRGGLDPARYSDWEVDGIASDF